MQRVSQNDAVATVREGEYLTAGDRAVEVARGAAGLPSCLNARQGEGELAQACERVRC